MNEGGVPILGQKPPVRVSAEQMAQLLFESIGRRKFQLLDPATIQKWQQSVMQLGGALATIQTRLTTMTKAMIILARENGGILDVVIDGAPMHVQITYTPPKEGLPERLMIEVRPEDQPEVKEPLAVIEGGLAGSEEPPAV